ncbi:MAG TPA: TonB family protein [Croceibacterium sp.]|nr:TonB family protein [Croceibacterium sp.]
MIPDTDLVPSPPPATGYAPRRRPRWGALALIVLLHLAAIAALTRVFAPDFARAALESATALVTVTISEPPPPQPEPSATPPDAGAAAPEGAKATPREVMAPRAPLPRPDPAPPAASTGLAQNSGAAVAGSGTGGGGEGTGTGSGGTGTGSGGGAQPLTKIAGDINNARDYPRAGREARRGHDVVIELMVGADGRVSQCRVTDPSPDAEADAITCQLATQRFVFRPRLNAAGEAVPGIYRWRQRWF